MVQHHDSVPSLNCTAISIDSPHMHRDGANYLNLLFTVYYDMCVYFKYIFHLPMGVVAPAQGAICIVFLRYKL